MYARISTHTTTPVLGRAPIPGARLALGATATSVFVQPSLRSGPALQRSSPSAPVFETAATKGFLATREDLDWLLKCLGEGRGAYKRRRFTGRRSERLKQRSACWSSSSSDASRPDRVSKGQDSGYTCVIHSLPANDFGVGHSELRKKGHNRFTGSDWTNV